MPPILMYHHVGDPPENCPLKPALFVRASEFEQQLQWLKAHRYTSILLEDLRQSFLKRKSLPRRCVVITFDDGYANNFELAYPLLRQYGFVANFFITTGYIGGTDAHGFRYMSAEQLRELQSAGMIIGSHTVTHPWLGRLPLEQAREELRESKKTLESILGAPVPWLCYPSGSFNDEVIGTARELGYVGACSVIRDNRPQARQLFFLPRVMVMRDIAPQRFAYLFHWSYHYLHMWKNRKRWPGR